MGCCGARTSQAEAGDQEFQSGPRYHSLTAVGLAYDMDAGRVFLAHASNPEAFSESCKLLP